MLRLKHRLKEPFGKAGLAVAVIALVFAMFGGAYAASNSSGGGKATASAKAKKGPRGPKGTTGTQGPAGAPGAAGKDGTNGTNGGPGTNGTSATTESFTGSAHGCTNGNGGVVVKSASPEVAVCNGKNGTNGTTGFTKTLPEKETETGIWTRAETSASSETVRIPISFPIPLTTAPTPVYVDVNEASAPGCPGRGEEGTEGLVGTPEADPGKLCVYAGQSEFVEPGESRFFTFKSEAGNPYAQELGTSTAGTVMTINCNAFCNVSGSWAATAPEE
jgi:hypothetical protein